MPRHSEFYEASGGYDSFEQQAASNLAGLEIPIHRILDVPKVAWGFHTDSSSESTNYDASVFLQRNETVESLSGRKLKQHTQGTIKVTTSCHCLP